MDNNPKANDRKVGKVTNKDRVLSIYSDAYYDDGLIMRKTGKYLNWDKNEVLGRGDNMSAAWRSAWRKIQRDMIEKLSR